MCEIGGTFAWEPRGGGGGGDDRHQASTTLAFATRRLALCDEAPAEKTGDGSGMPRLVVHDHFQHMHLVERPNLLLMAVQSMTRIYHLLKNVSLCQTFKFWRVALQPPPSFGLMELRSRPHNDANTIGAESLKLAGRRCRRGMGP